MLSNGRRNLLLRNRSISERMHVLNADFELRHEAVFTAHLLVDTTSGQFQWRISEVKAYSR